MNALRNSKRTASRGFTLIEIMVAAGIASFAVATAFTFARFQVSAFRTQTEVTHMNASSSLLFQQLQRDLSSISAGASFWVGVEPGAFSALAGEVWFPGYGIPSIRPSNNVASIGTDINDPMPGSDIISLIRYESDSTFIPASGTGETHIPPVITNLGTGFTLDDPSVLSCANRHLDNDGRADGLLLISNMAVNTAASFILPVIPLNAATTFPGNPGPVFFANEFLINPQSAARGAGAIVPTGAGPGSQLVCARPVAYWVDRGGRLRLWRSTTSRPAGSLTVTPTGPDGDFVARIDPDRDIVLAEGIEELQLAYLTNSAATGRANQWIYGDPALGPAGASFGAFTALAEIRAVRVSAVIRTARRDQVTHPANRPARMEDKVVANNPVVGCTDPLVCYDSRYLRRTVRFMSELRNLRFFDLMTQPGLTSAEITSFVP